MRHICDACFEAFPSGSLQDVPGRVMPTIPVPCDRCQTELSGGHDVYSFPQFPLYFPPEPNA